MRADSRAVGKDGAVTDHETLAARRLLLVHAHPDDETIGSGATMARYLAEGVHVTLVTCTSGEEGEVLVSDLAHLASDQTDELGAHRRDELARAMAQLGVTDHRLLGGPGRYRDSGMVGTPPNERPDSFWQTDLKTTADDLVPIIREIRPQVLVTYDDFGGYGHPDHIKAHRTAMYAAALAATPSYRPEFGAAWEIEKIYWTALPKSWVQRGIDALVAAGGTGFFGVESADDLPFIIDDEYVSTVVDGKAFVDKKVAALREHATQIDDTGPFFAMSEHLGPEALGVEFYRISKGNTVPDSSDDDGRETDLFAGVTT
jgi:N-acetyl-1-D-myo-inositol-2-amino-2-deoxy-alpha-D-glucopyranoside deacetylase